MINFDNSATTYPKPAAVANAARAALLHYGGNPGRGGHTLSLQAAQKVFETREKAARMFKAQTENVVFTPNCTFALNMAIKGVLSQGSHVILSDHEHNAAARPVYALSKTKGVSFSVAQTYPDPKATLESFRKLIRPDTRAIVCTAASNVTGAVMPVKALCDLAKQHHIPLIVDAAQACGVLDLTLDDGMDFLCLSGHKALYGPTGTGLLISNGSYQLDTIIEGGTGATSASLEQTPFLPEKLESGTLNTVGIIALAPGLDFVQKMTPKRIYDHEMSLCKRLEDRLRSDERITLYETDRMRSPVLAFNIRGIHSEETARLLSRKGFALRGGIQCAALTHKTLGTLDTGVVRFSPSLFNNFRQTDMLAGAILSLKTP